MTWNFDSWSLAGFYRFQRYKCAQTHGFLADIPIWSWQQGTASQNQSLGQNFIAFATVEYTRSYYFRSPLWILFLPPCFYRCVSVHGGGGEQVPPGTRYTPCTSCTPWTRYTPLGTRYTPEQYMLGDTGNKRAVRILLECILVFLFSHIAQSKPSIHWENL